MFIIVSFSKTLFQKNARRAAQLQERSRKLPCLGDLFSPRLSGIEISGKHRCDRREEGTNIGACGLQSCPIGIRGRAKGLCFHDLECAKTIWSVGCAGFVSR
jgi:hypothetical protein